MNTAPHATTTTALSTGPDRVFEAVVGSIADAERASRLQTEPLLGATDPDALEALFRDDGSSVTVESDHHGYRLRVSAGEVVIYDD